MTARDEKTMINMIELPVVASITTSGSKEK
jgi:hypothetical protein